MTILVEGNPTTPVDTVNAVPSGHAFLDDIAHHALQAHKHVGEGRELAKLAGSLPDDAADAVGKIDPNRLTRWFKHELAPRLDRALPDRVIRDICFELHQ